MKSKSTFCKPIAWLLTLAMIFSILPVSVFATEDIETDIVKTLTDVVCDCGTDDPAIHATNCAVYVAPENPVCYCTEKCTEDNINVWCDVCGFDYTACSGTDTAAAFEAVTGLTIGNVTITETGMYHVPMGGTSIEKVSEGEEYSPRNLEVLLDENGGYMLVDYGALLSYQKALNSAVNITLTSGNLTLESDSVNLLGGNITVDNGNLTIFAYGSLSVGMIKASGIVNIETIGNDLIVDTLDLSASPHVVISEGYDSISIANISGGSGLYRTSADGAFSDTAPTSLLYENYFEYISTTDIGNIAQNDDGTTHSKKCSCSLATVIETGDCSGGTATCTTQAVCENCGASYGEKDANNHNWENGVCTYGCGITHDPHTFENGKCTACGLVCDHSGNTSKPVDNGDGTHDKACSVCGDVVMDNENHTLTYAANGNTITESCSTNCGYSETATITAENATYNGIEHKTATVAYSEGWQGGDLTVSYENNTDAGTATASITVGGVTASVDFEITPVTYNVTVITAINGTVTADKTTAAEGDMVTLTVAPATGYVIDSVKYNDTEIPVNNGVYAFSMPAGDVTVNATFSACDHSGSQHTTGSDNGDGKHSYTCTDCGGTGTEDHTLDETIGQTCKGYMCEYCDVWYGEADLSAHVFASDNKTCKYCQQTIVAKVTRDDIVSYYTAIEDVDDGEEDSTNVLTVLANTTLTESVNLGFMSLERVGDVTITVPEEYYLKVLSTGNKDNTVSWIGSMGYSVTSRQNRLIFTYEALPEELSVTYFLLRDATVENLKIKDGAYNGYLIVTEGVTLTVTDTMAVECTGGQTEISGTLILGDNAAMTNGDKITVTGMLVMGKNATITNSNTICLDNSEVYTTVHHIPTGIIGGSVKVNGITYTYVSEGSTDEEDFAPHWTCDDHTGDLSKATCVNKVNCDHCGDSFGNFGGHSCNIETGYCVHCNEYVAVASVTDGTTTLYANYGAQLEEVIEIFLEVESIRDITVVLPDGELLDHVGNGVKTAVHGEQQTVHLTIQGVTTIPADSELVALSQLAFLSLPDVTYMEAGALKEMKLQTLALTAEGTITLEEGFMDTDRIGQVDLVLCCNKASAVTDGVTWNGSTFKSVTFTEHDYVNSVCRNCSAVCDHSDSQHTTATDNGDGKHSFTCSVCYEAVNEEHVMSLAANGSIITATCSANCGYSGTATVSANGKIYDGTAVEATVNKVGSLADTNFGIIYAVKDGIPLESAPVNAGAYTASIGMGENENAVVASVDFTIAKAQAVITVDDTPIVKTYGEAWELPEAATNFGTVTVDTTVADMENAGEYTVTYTVVGDDNYNGATKTVNVTINPKPITGATVDNFEALTYTGQELTPSATVTIDGLTVTGTWSVVRNVADKTTFTASGNFTGTITDKETGMAKADSSVTTVPGANELTYSEAAQELVTAGVANGGTLKYSLDNATWVDAIPTGTDADTYEVWYKVFGDANHNDTDSVKVDVTIAKKSIEAATVAVAGALTYTGAEQTQNVTVSLDGFTVTFDVTDNKATNVKADGNYTLKVTANGNFTGEKTLEWNIAKADHIIEGENIPTASRIRRGNKLSDSTITPAELKDADENVLGTFTWVTPDDEMTETGDFVKQVKFTPADTNNYNEKTFDVTVNVYRPSSGGGGSSNTSTTTTKNEDGSTTKVTENKATGTKTEVTTNTDGSTTTVETKKDGTVTTTEKDKDGNTTTTVEKSDGTSTTTEKNKDGSEKVIEKSADGTTVTTEKDTDGTKTVTTENADGSKTTEETKKDGTKVVTETNSDGETTAEVVAKGETEVVIPVPDAEEVYEVVVTDENGNETVITDFEVVDGGVAITVDGNASVSLSKGSKKEFVDVHPVDHWSEESVDYVYIRGLMKGTSENHFSPDATLTRAMLVTILYRLEGEPAAWGGLPFEDVEEGSYYEFAVAWAKANGIVNGTSATTFEPNVSITREQIAAIMHRYADFKGHDVSVGENTNILSYDDVHHVSEYAIGAMQYAVGSGLIKGKTESTLNPLDNATRAEAAAILERFIKAN